jgi:hypothetical protein
LAIRNEEELNKLLSSVTIAQGGVLPHIQAVLLPKKAKSKKDENRITKPSPFKPHGPFKGHHILQRAKSSQLFLFI